MAKRSKRKKRKHGRAKRGEPRPLSQIERRNFEYVKEHGTVLLNCIVDIFAGAMIGIAIPFFGMMIGIFLEHTVQQPFFSEEFAPFVVVVITVPGGFVVGLLGALIGRWQWGLGIGAVLHAIVFAYIVATSDYPVTVQCWIFTVGTISGGIAGAVGASRRSLPTSRGIENRGNTSGQP